MSRIVVKLGGELLTEERREEAQALARDLAAVIAAGHAVIVVHGGGPQTSELQRRLGQEPAIVGGRRITDAAALDAIAMVVGGKLNIALCSLLAGAGLRPVGLSGTSARVIAAVKRPPRVVSGSEGVAVDFGHVGDVVGVNRELLELLLGAGYLPVLACIGADEAGAPYNINADVVASELAVAIAADRLILITGTPGVLREVGDPSSRIPRLTVAEGRALIASGVVSGGMIPKLEESFATLTRGVKEIHVLGRLGPGDLARALSEPGAVGTALGP